MKLYFAPNACSLASHIALVESGIEYELELVDLINKKTEYGQDFKQINVKNYVPALELDNGELLTENLAVLQYIAEIGNKLLPATGMDRWRVLEAVTFVSTEIHKNFKPLFDPRFGAAAADHARELIADRLALLDDKLGEKSYFVGGRLSIAELYLFVSLIWARMMKITIPSRIEELSERMTRLTSVGTALERERTHPSKTPT